MQVGFRAGTLVDIGNTALHLHILQVHYYNYLARIKCDHKFVKILYIIKSLVIPNFLKKGITPKKILAQN